MKIRIKETDEVLEDVKFIDTTLHKITIQYLDNGILRECTIKNLSDIEEVKDYEEPKDYYWIDYDGKVKSFIDLYEWQDKMKEIGNYFENKEKAERAVEKLKAIKRLKDKGFRFDGYDSNKIDYVVSDGYLDRGVDMEFLQDFALLFGGEE